MLKEALALRADATSFPIVIYGVSINHAKQMLETFARLATESGAVVTRGKRYELILDSTDTYKFRSYAEQDSPAGQGYSHIFVDHYARDYWFQPEILGSDCISL